MKPTRFSIACQGGGSQTAFTAGALAALTDRGESENAELVGLSGTSGGALCAAIAWYSLRKREEPKSKRLLDFWRDNTAHGWYEEALNQSIIDSMRMINRGMLPTLQLSPSSPLSKMMMSFMSLGTRRCFTDFPELLRNYIDFDELARWGASPKAPVLIIGASNVTSGAMAKFVSTREPIRLEHILASCCVPNIFPAVEIDGQAYWDGLFSDNPPVEELVRPRSVGLENIPEEIWLIKINPTARKKVPVDPADITDRRNQVEGNISLFHQLDHLEMINDMILAGAFKPEFLAQLDVKTAIRIPKSFASAPGKPYHIPCIEMPQEVQDSLDYEGKIDRSAKNIEWLIEQGHAAANRFLNERRAVIAASPPLTPGNQPAESLRKAIERKE